MKKILLTMVACAAMVAQAQTVSVVKQVADNEFGMIPASLTTGDKALFVFMFNFDDKGYGTGNERIQIMDSSFGDVKTLNLPTKDFQSYRIVYDVVDGKKVNGVKEDGYAQSYALFETTWLYDVENFDDESHGVAVSQTLFNSDENFEYLRPEYEMGVEYTYSSGDKFYENYRPLLKGMSVVQDNGTVLATIQASTGRAIHDVSVLKSYDGLYFVVEEIEVGDDERGYSTVVYKWNNDTNSISHVKEFSGMRTYPNPARRNETVTVDVPENVREGSLIVTNSAGVTLQTVKLNGQRQAAVSTARMTSGVYNVTLVSGAKRLQTSRIIVK